MWETFQHAWQGAWDCLAFMGYGMEVTDIALRWLLAFFHAGFG
jgi:hypothetical protein